MSLTDIISALLESDVPLVVDADNETFEIKSQPLRIVFATNILHELLFHALTDTPEERLASYRDSGTIETDFVALTDHLLQLSIERCQADLRIFARAGPLLEQLISGLRSQENVARRNINPRRAQEHAQIERMLRSEFLNRPITPNEIDAMQTEALRMYQSCRYARRALAEILATVKKIDGVLNQEDEPEGLAS